MDPELQRTILLADVDLASFLGHRDRLIADLEAQHPGVSLHARDRVLTLRGPLAEVRLAERVVHELLRIARLGGTLTEHEVREASDAVRETQEGGDSDESDRTGAGGEPVGGGSGGDGRAPGGARLLSEPILTVRGRAIRPQTRGQRAYVAAIDAHTITFGIGPAGTGKTYLAMAKAVQSLTRREVSKIILTRSAVEAGERLGYLPGSLEEKIDPYLRPLFDAVGSMMEAEVVPKLLSSGTIEVAPLAYMRGRTLNESFVVLDEAQNTTPEQLKMFLTRLGYGSKMVVTGDLTQTDLPLATSGLRVVREILRRVEDIHFAELGSDDIVRHSLVGRIVDAYAAHEGAQRGDAV